MNAPKRQLVGAPLAGRRVGIAVFWCLAVFVAVASIRSVLIELYAKPGQSGHAGSGDESGNTARCASELRSLHGELLERASAEVKAPGDLAHTQHWLRAWDARFATTHDLCGGMWETRDTLQTLRRKLEAMLRDYARDQRPLTESIERALSYRVPPAFASILIRES